MTTADSKGRRLIWVLSALGLSVFIVIAYSARSQILLSSRFHLVSRLTSSKSDMVSGDRMDPDDLRALAEFPPREIAKYLDSSNPAWRAIACQVLRAQADTMRDADCRGIVPLLASMVLNDPEPSLRRQAYEIFSHVPSLHIDDARAILTQFRGKLASPIGVQLTALIAKRCPELADELRAFLLEAATESADNDAVVLLISDLFPDDASLTRLLQQVAQRGEVRRNIVRAVRRVAHSRPEILTDLLDGEESEQRVAIIALTPPSRNVMAAPPPDSELVKWDALDPHVIDRAMTLATAFLRTTASESQALAINFFEAHPESGHTLLQGLADSADSEGRIGILKAINRIAWTSYSSNGKFQFTKPEGDFLLALLDDADDRVRAEVAHVISASMSGDSQQGADFRPGSGPSDPANANVFRRLLDAPTGDLDWLALQYFSRVTPFAECDIDLMLRVVRRDEEVQKARRSNTRRSWPADHTVRTLCERYPNHPGVIKYAEELTLNSDEPLEADLALCLLQSPPQRTAVINRITTLGASSNTKDIDRFKWVAVRILAQAVKQAEILDDALRYEVVDQFLPRIWFAEPWPVGLPDRDQLTSLLGTEKVSELEVIALRRYLEAQFFGDPSAAQSSARFASRISSTPRLVEEAIRITESAVAIDDVQVRARALMFVRDTKIHSANLVQAAVDGLDHRDASVIVAAADALGSLHIDKPYVTKKLRELVDRKQAEWVRAEVLRNLTLLSPDDPDTRGLIEALCNDPNIAVQAEAKRALKALQTSP